MYAVYEVSMAVVELYSPDAVPTVPQALVALGTVRGFVINKEHVFLLAGDVRNHPPGAASLLYVPDNLIISLPTVEGRTDACPGLGEVELVRLSFVPEGR